MNANRNNAKAAGANEVGSVIDLVLAVLSEHREVKLGAFRVFRFSDCKDGIGVREDGSGLSFYDKLSKAGIRRVAKWINAVRESRRMESEVAA